MDINLLAKGKTKWIEEAPDRPVGEILQRNLPYITWDDTYSVLVPGKDVWSAQTSANVFEFLARHDIPLAYVERAKDPACFYALQCEMIPIEVVVRLANEPESSYSKRNPDAPFGPFATPQVEFFLKTVKKIFNHKTVAYDDPYISNLSETDMYICNPKAPVEPGEQVPYTEVFGHDPLGLFQEMSVASQRLGTVLSTGFQTLGWKLGDFKIEFGRTRDGRIVPADDLNNDSWRATDTVGVERSKQQVRNCKAVTPQTLINYQMVMELTSRLN